MPSGWRHFLPPSWMTDLIFRSDCCWSKAFQPGVWLYLHLTCQAHKDAHFLHESKSEWRIFPHPVLKQTLYPVFGFLCWGFSLSSKTLLIKVRYMSASALGHQCRSFTRQCSLSSVLCCFLAFCHKLWFSLINNFIVIINQVIGCIS